MSNKKFYLLDTSVILDDPTNLLRLYDNGQNGIFITDIVLAELNNQKDQIETEVGYRAREFFRLVDNENGKTIHYDDLPHELKERISYANGDKYYILEVNFENSFSGKQESFEQNSMPLFIIYRENYKTDKNFHQQKGKNDAKIAEIGRDYNLMLVTNDISFKIASDISGIHAQTLRNSRVENPNKIDFSFILEYEIEPTLPQEHQFCNFDQLIFKETKTQEGQKYFTGIERYALYINGNLEFLDFDTRFGDEFKGFIKPINLEQKFFYSILTHPQNFVTVVAGSTGSGKTLIALQAAISMVKEGLVEGIVYARNTVTSTDRQSELGFRKGDQNVKLNYFMYPLYSAINFTIEQIAKQSITTNIEYLKDNSSIKKESSTETFMKEYNIEVVDIAHLRGTTISRKFVIIDEAQNLTNSSLKLIGTRMGDKTKLVILGDTRQIDHPFLSKRRNALVTLLQKAKGDCFVSGIQLRHTIRSEIASWFDIQF